LRKLMGGPEAGEKGVAGKKGDLGKAEMLKTETLKGRILRWTPRFGGFGRILSCFHLP
jgi:hypothetical protein